MNGCSYIRKSGIIDNRVYAIQWNRASPTAKYGTRDPISKTSGGMGKINQLENRSAL